MLQVTGLSKDFDGFQAINDVNFRLQENEHHAIIGCGRLQFEVETYAKTFT